MYGKPFFFSLCTQILMQQLIYFLITIISFHLPHITFKLFNAGIIHFAAWQTKYAHLCEKCRLLLAGFLFKAAYALGLLNKRFSSIFKNVPHTFQ